MIFQPDRYSYTFLFTEKVVAYTKLLVPLNELPDFKSRIGIIALKILMIPALEVATVLDLVRWTIKTTYSFNKTHYINLISVVAAFIFNFGILAGYRLRPKQNPGPVRLDAHPPSITLTGLPEAIHATTSYQAWHETHQQWLNHPKLKKLLNRDEVLKRLVCPITKKIPKVPVAVFLKTNFFSEITFEAEAIIKWLNKNPKKSFPIMNFISLFDIPYINGVYERIQTLYLKTLERTPQAILFEHLRVIANLPIGVDMLVYSYVIDQNNVYIPFNNASTLWSEKVNAAINALIEKRSNNEISEDSYSDRILKLYTYTRSVKRIVFLKMNRLKKLFSKEYRIRTERPE